MRKADRVRLQHMLDAANEALTFIRGRVRADLDSDRMLVLSLIRELEIIGEAAGKVSAETRSQNTSIPWQDITGMRNRLIMPILMLTWIQFGAQSTETCPH